MLPINPSAFKRASKFTVPICLYPDRAIPFSKRIYDISENTQVFLQILSKLCCNTFWFSQKFLKGGLGSYKGNILFWVLKKGLVSFY